MLSGYHAWSEKEKEIKFNKSIPRCGKCQETLSRTEGLNPNTNMKNTWSSCAWPLSVDKQFEGIKGIPHTCIVPCPNCLSYTVIRNQSASVRKDCDKNTRRLNVLEESEWEMSCQEELKDSKLSLRFQIISKDSFKNRNKDKFGNYATLLLI